MIDILIAVVLDFLIGDPHAFPHPVKLMGNIISFEEKVARKLAKTKQGLKISGLFIVMINVFLALLVPFSILKLLAFNKILFSLVRIYFIYTMISARGLNKEAMQVIKALKASIENARKRLAYIVGRDTKELTREEIIRATIETVAENTSDGVIAPLFYILISVPFGFVYKFVNTMDSMLGYKNDEYIDLGYFPAKVDDLFNLIPARITAALMVLTSLLRFDTKNGIKILIRDRKNHNSPNSGYPESAVAGLLGIQLGGSHHYKGVLVYKPTIGDDLVNISTIHIHSTIDIMYRTEIGFLVIYIITWFLLN
jgi:adenosylcobinamide-phosphate synthase